MIDKYLRPDLPKSAPFTVSQAPCLAKLDQNECPFDLPSDLKYELTEAVRAATWNRYPQPLEYANAKQHVASVLNISPDNLIITVGCDQVIQGAYWLAGGWGRKALVFEPTYPMLYHAGKLSCTEVTRIQAGPQYEIDAGAFPGHSLILIACPNNPTGGLPPVTLIEQALQQPAFVMVDEAYYDLSQHTMLDQISKYPNLFIGRSCSKSLLAGMRLGFGIGHPAAVAALEQLLTAPYHLAKFQLILAQHYEQILPHVRAAAEYVRSERERVAAALKAMNVIVYPSVTNFLMFEVDEPAVVFQRLVAAGIRLRNLTQLSGLTRHLRVTIGRKKENDLFLAELDKALEA